MKQFDTLGERILFIGLVALLIAAIGAVFVPLFIAIARVLWYMALA